MNLASHHTIPLRWFHIYVRWNGSYWDGEKEYRKEVPLNPEFPADHIYNSLYELCIYHPYIEEIEDIEIVVDEMMPDLLLCSMKYSMKENNMKYPREMLEAILKTKVQKALWIHQKQPKEQPQKKTPSLLRLFKGKETE